MLVDRTCTGDLRIGVQRVQQVEALRVQITC